MRISEKDSLELWHKRYRHLGLEPLKSLAKKKAVMAWESTKHNTPKNRAKVLRSASSTETCFRINDRTRTQGKTARPDNLQ